MTTIDYPNLRQLAGYSRDLSSSVKITDILIRGGGGTITLSNGETVEFIYKFTPNSEVESGGIFGISLIDDRAAKVYETLVSQSITDMLDWVLVNTDINLRVTETEGAIVQLDVDLASLETRVDALESTNLEPRVEDLETDVATLQSDVSDAESDIATLDSRVDALETTANRLTAYRIISTNSYTILTSDRKLIVKADSDLSLPTVAAAAGIDYKVKNQGSYTVTVAPDGLETIDGVNDSIIINPFESLDFFSDGIEWSLV